jgi:hypothetical protein
VRALTYLSGKAHAWHQPQHNRVISRVAFGLPSSAQSSGVFVAFRDSHSSSLSWPYCSAGQPQSMSLLLHHSSLSLPIPRSPRSHSECFPAWPKSSRLPSDRNRRISYSAWGPCDWLNTTRLQRRSCSANLSKTPVWSRPFDKSSVRVKQPRNEMLNQSNFRPDSQSLTAFEQDKISVTRTSGESAEHPCRMLKKAVQQGRSE